MELIERAQHIKAVALDGDGVIFTGRAFIDPIKGEALKERSHVDGQGISLLRAVGIRIAMVSAEKTGFVEMLGKKMNELPSVKNGKWPPVGVFVGLLGKEKVAAVDAWLKEIGVAWADCAFMGDDLSDYEILQRVGFAAAPGQAEEVIKRCAHWVAPRRGGDGAVRDLANLILEAKGIDVTNLVLR